MRIVLLIISLFLLNNCEKKEKTNCWDPWFGYCRIWFDRIQDNEAKARDRENSCRQPNSIKTCSTSNDCACTSNRISQGAIFDNGTKLYVTTETINLPTALSCLCPNAVVPRIKSWSKGKELNQETFPPNLFTDFITTDTNLDTSALLIGTNLFCTIQCTGSIEFKYQVLKLRSNP